MDTTVHGVSEEQIKEVEWVSGEVWLEMYKKNILCDAILKTEDGGIFAVHKSLLALCTPFFMVLFSKSWSDPIPGIDKKVLEAIIDFGYSGSTIVTNENVVDLLIGADRLTVIGLLKKCCDFLLRNLSIGNCIKMREFAKVYYCFDLEEKTDKFLMNNFVEVSKQSKEFLELSLHEVTELLNSDRINVKNEEQVWEACLRWIDHRSEENRQYIDRIMRCVRLGLLDNEFFMDNVKTHEYVENNDLCRSIVIETLKFHWDLQTIDQKTEEMETPLLATPRLPNSILFIIGGWSGGAPTDLVESYDIKADLWVQVNETDPAGPRAYHKLAVIENDIYVIGGLNRNGESCSSCRCFNAVTKKWSEISPMHSKRCYVSVAVLDNLIFAMGGYNGHRRQNTVERFDYRANQWTFVSPMNYLRSDACATTLNGFIYIAGGFNGVESLASCEYYNPAIDQWTSVTSMHQWRSGVSVISHHGKIYALGGFTGISRLQSGERFDPVTGVWTEIPDMFNPRSNFATEIMDDMIFAIGGFNGETVRSDVEYFDDCKNEWFEATDMNIYRSALAACVIHELPNINDYIRQDRRGLIEEKRQRMQLLNNMERALLDGREILPQMIEGAEDIEEEDDDEEEEF